MALQLPTYSTISRKTELRTYAFKWQEQKQYIVQAFRKIDLKMQVHGQNNIKVNLPPAIHRITELKRTTGTLDRGERKGYADDTEVPISTVQYTIHSAIITFLFFFCKPGADFGANGCWCCWYQGGNRSLKRSSTMWLLLLLLMLLLLACVLWCCWYRYFYFIIYVWSWKPNYYSRCLDGLIALSFLCDNKCGWWSSSVSRLRKSLDSSPLDEGKYLHQYLYVKYRERNGVSRLFRISGILVFMCAGRLYTWSVDVHISHVCRESNEETRYQRERVFYSSCRCCCYLGCCRHHAFPGVVNVILGMVWSGKALKTFVSSFGCGPGNALNMIENAGYFRRVMQYPRFIFFIQASTKVCVGLEMFSTFFSYTIMIPLESIWGRNRRSPRGYFEKT